MKRIGIIGCGYVFDHYMSTMHHHPGIEVAGVADLDSGRLAEATRFYGLSAYPDVASLLADPGVDIVANFTPIPSHHAVSRAALEAGKHVYSEKPLAASLEEARDLAALARAKGLRLSCAPSNALSATSQTMWKAVADGVVGDVLLVYAEFDDNPITLMKPEGWRSRSGAPWPYLHEYEMGSTWEHIGYHLTWMCAMFGPVAHVTAFSKQIIRNKTHHRLDPADTPDFSVACLDFASGVTGRITCSIAAPLDHRMRIIGDKGMIHADTYRHYECPVQIEPFTSLGLNARKSRLVRSNPLLQRLLGVGGRRVPLIPGPSPGSDQPVRLVERGRGLRSWLQARKQEQLGRQDKSVGLAELAAAIEEDRPHFPSAAFTLHLTELTLAVQAAGPRGASHRLETTFSPAQAPTPPQSGPDYNRFTRPPVLDRFVADALDRMHDPTSGPRRR